MNGNDARDVIEIAGPSVGPFGFSVQEPIAVLDFTGYDGTALAQKCTTCGCGFVE